MEKLLDELNRHPGNLEGLVEATQAFCHAYDESSIERDVKPNY